MLTTAPALDRPDLLATGTRKLLESWRGEEFFPEIFAVEIDPERAGGEEFCADAGVPREAGANCVIVEASRGDRRNFAAVLTPVAASRTDFNGAVRRALDARRVGLAPRDAVVAATGMKVGSITGVGLPTGWPVLVAAELASQPRIAIGAGLLRGKLLLPGRALRAIPGAMFLENLWR